MYIAVECLLTVAFKPPVPHLVGLIEEVLQARAQTAYDTKRISQYVKSQYQHVHLLDRLETRRNTSSLQQDMQSLII